MTLNNQLYFSRTAQPTLKKTNKQRKTMVATLTYTSVKLKLQNIIWMVFRNKAEYQKPNIYVAFKQVS